VVRRGGGDATCSVIQRIDERTRVAELARMLTGSTASPASRRAAQELLAAARRLRPAA
jgi:DNA repair ATPase RecN